MTVTVAGVDGCRGGWLCVLRRVEPPFCERAFVFQTFEQILRHPETPAVIAIDMPIGLPDRIVGPGRDCDCAARAVLGKRAPAVFAVPARAVLEESDYWRACATASSRSDPPRRISKQMFYLFPKIREIDRAMSPALQDRVRECHPEAAFWAMNDSVPLAEPKKIRGRPHGPGLEQRRELLIARGFSEALVRGTSFPASIAGPDDVLDACACAWSAARIFKRESLSFPVQPPLDPRGLRMEIVV